MADKPKTAIESPPLHRYCPVCNHGDVRRIAQRNNIAINVNLARGALSPAFALLVVDIFVCQNCGFVMHHATNAKQHTSGE